MSTGRPVNPRFDDDMRFNEVSPGPARYQSRTEKPVRYLAVVGMEDSVILGYVWASDEDDAAGWVTREAGGPPAFNEGVLWSIRLHEAKEKGLRPMQALNELIRDGGAGGIGKILSDSRAEAPDAATVAALAKES